VVQAGEREAWKSTTESAKKSIIAQYGFIGAKDATNHTDRLGVREITTRYAGETDICEALLGVTRLCNEYSAPVPEIGTPATALQNSTQKGVGGPGSKLLKASALRPVQPTRGVFDGLDAEELKNTCSLCCVICGIEADMCKIKKPAGGGKLEFTTGHSQAVREKLQCAAFAAKCNEEGWDEAEVLR